MWRPLLTADSPTRSDSSSASEPTSPEALSASEWFTIGDASCWGTDGGGLVIALCRVVCVGVCTVVEGYGTPIAGNIRDCGGRSGCREDKEADAVDSEWKGEVSGSGKGAGVGGRKLKEGGDVASDEGGAVVRDLTFIGPQESGEPREGNDREAGTWLDRVSDGADAGEEY